MKKLETGNTILGILLGMLGGIALTSALAWLIFKNPTPFVNRNQVVARDLKLPPNTVEELLAAQRRTGNLDAVITLNGYRVRTNSRHEIFVTPLTASGVKPQPEIQVVRKLASNDTVNKQNFEFYEILEQRHYPVIPAPAVQEHAVRNTGAAPITIYPASPEPATPTANVAEERPLVTINPSSNRVAVIKPVAPDRPQNVPFVSNKVTASTDAPHHAASQVASTPPVKSLTTQANKTPTTPPSQTESQLTYLEVEFFPDYDGAAKLQQKLLEKGLPVHLKEQKYLKKRAGYTVAIGPYSDQKSLTSAKAKLHALGMRASAQIQ
ncbi:MAG: SPOR domain-containing protein [Gallionella sp.]|nr:SPOR domain-containing protein [Gallionella sp.]